MKTKQYGLIYVLYRTEKDIFKIAPVRAGIMISSLVIQSATVGLQALYMSKMFTYAEKSILDYSQRESTINSLIMMILIFLLRQIVGVLFSSSMLEVDAKVLYQLNMKLDKKCTNIPLIYFEDSDWKDELTRAKQCLKWTRLSDLSLSFYNIISELISLISVMVVIASFNIWLIPISFFSVIPFFIMRLIRGNQFYKIKWFQASQERKKAYFFNLFNNKQSVKEIKIMNISAYLFDKWNEYKDQINSEEWNFRRKDLTSLLWCECIRTIGYLLGVVFVIGLATKELISIGMMTGCMVAFKGFQDNMKYIFINIGRIPEYAAFCGDYYRFIDMEIEEDGKAILNQDFEKIQLSNVSFSYPNMDKSAIDNVSCEIHNGESVVILGENGSGKTTLSKLILGLYKTQHGTVMYNGKNINDIDKEVFYKDVAIVSQDYMQYNFSLRENITLSDKDDEKTKKRVTEILDFLDLDELISKKDGIDILMGNEFGGVELSKGQWQKIAIARTLYKENKIVFLDESTSALDPIIENEILKKFLSIMQGKTAIIVSHRVGLCKEVDKIIVMREGKIVEIGDHETLYNKKGEYYRLYSTQAKWYK